MKINVTQAFCPPIEEYIGFLNIAWKNKWLTNRGELVLALESKLKKHLDVPYLTLTANGTLSIQLAIKAMDIKGEIITTPFSYIATSSSIFWENCTPVFVDIHPEYLTINEDLIEKSITNKTTAIVATHVFGNPCNVIKIESIAYKYNLKVIYDAAHCFGVKYKGESIFNYGDVSTCSFHATKVFHTGEGGCWITKNKVLQDKMYSYHNFGHNGEEQFHGLGINAKMSELQAALGLAVFNHIEPIIEKRKELIQEYNNLLEGVNIKTIKLRQGVEWNYSYFPVIFNSEKELLQTKKKMNKKNIFPRRYFYPSLNTVDYLKGKSAPISEDISKRVLCLPLYDSLSKKDLRNIISLI